MLMKHQKVKIRVSKPVSHALSYNSSMYTFQTADWKTISLELLGCRIWNEKLKGWKGLKNQTVKGLKWNGIEIIMGGPKITCMYWFSIDFYW